MHNTTTTFRAEPELFEFLKAELYAVPFHNVGPDGSDHMFMFQNPLRFLFCEQGKIVTEVKQNGSLVFADEVTKEWLVNKFGYDEDTQR